MTSRKNILKIINDNSLELYCLLKDNKIETKLVYDAILSKSNNLLLESIVPVSDMKIKNLELDYPKENCLDEILYLTDKKYKHLRDIRYVVNMNLIVDTIISEKIYLEKLKIHYTDLIIDLLVEDFYDYKSLQIFSKLKQQVIELDSDINYKIIENINKYYIQKITI